MSGMPIYQIVNGTTTGTAVILDWTQTPFNASLAVSILNGTGTFTAQYTLDNPNAAIDQGSASTTVTWFNDVNIALASANIAGNYMFPVRALRLAVQSSAATGQFQFAVIQGFTG